MSLHDLTPWRNRRELLWVREQFYNVADSTAPDERRKTCSLVHIWKLRGHVPHAVESTALLTEAVLADEAEIASSIVRFSYATVLCRFVTGLVDSDQKARYRVSMHEKAKQLGLPAALVELRHEITHQELPSLDTLRWAVKKSLQWLWDDYWSHLTPYSTDKSDILGVKERLKAILRRYSDEGRRIGSGDGKQLAALTPVASEVAGDLLKFCWKNVRAVDELAHALVKRNALIPPGRQLNESMEDFVELWDPMLKQLIARQPRFLISLMDRMAMELSTPPRGAVQDDPKSEAVTIWLERLFTSEVYSSAIKRARVAHDGIMTTCLNCPNYWTIRLARCIMESSQDLKEIYSSPFRKRIDLTRKVGESHAEEQGTPRLQNSTNSEGQGSWNPATNWVPKPFGSV